MFIDNHKTTIALLVSLAVISGGISAGIETGTVRPADSIETQISSEKVLETKDSEVIANLASEKKSLEGVKADLTAALSKKKDFAALVGESQQVIKDLGGDSEDLKNQITTSKVAVAKAVEPKAVEKQINSVKKSLEAYKQTIANKVEADALTEAAEAAKAEQVSVQEAKEWVSSEPLPAKQEQTKVKQSPVAQDPAPAPVSNQDSMMAQYRAILDSVGGGWVSLSWRPGAEALSSPGVIYIGEAIWGDPVWVMRHELAHQYQYKVGYYKLIANEKFKSVYGSDIEVLANCMAAQMGSANGGGCANGAQSSFASAIISGYLP